ncbi:Plasmodium exported protein, unknown function [Plasmodium knowlesi strain H]|uniref:Uncharacterized protein n=2 Tax=Plasmodium knowlesi (strain H) TaxID=5851 RepID=A0A5K1V991_PLAKH|nr:uncharacterized protein PKNH_1357100 [Plasmodium knowlesi strain H]CAA9990596.1 Plasmodium exported protein, unknown function [Plasmodium knowlesi strain H]SBO19876.1 Plasmodium exported protein, unknown function [Plasmodium knowlesi strain H]VVS80070.1 Plasmodium exported protein, unknown function [Plasmodium knowlesi strain H]|eukprot:XP_002260980.1 [Plasmodium knowlesi strain H]
MPVATRQNKKGRKAGAFLFCTKVSLYTLLIWIVNCSNSCQYDGNSYSVMNNSLGKAFDSRALRSLAEALEEEAVQHDAPVAYEDEIEQDGPVVYEEATEQDAPVEHEEVIEQVAQDVAQEVAQQVPQHSGKKGKKEYKDGKSTSVGLRGANKENEKDSYRQGKLDFWEHFEPTITANFEEVLKRCISRKAGEQDVDEYYSAGFPKLGWNANPYGVLKKTKKGTVQEGYRKMLENNFRNVPYMDDTQNDHTSNEPYLEREYGHVELGADAKTSTNLRKGAEKKMNKKM